MAQYNDLQVYMSTYDLLLAIFQFTKEVEYRHVLKRAWKWHLSYLQFEDNNIEEDIHSTTKGTLN